MIHKNIVLFILMLLALGCTGKEKDQVQLEGIIWTDKNAEWVSPVGAGGEQQFSMNLSPMYFGPDGFFKRMGWTIFRKHRLGESSFGGEGGVNIAGAWLTQNDSLYVAHQIVYRAIRKIGETLPTPIEVECITMKELSHSPPSFTFGGRTYVPEGRIDERGTEFLAAQWWPDSISTNLEQHLEEYLKK